MSPYVVAVTGGIASGKSEITRRFEALGAACFDADQAARDVVALGTPGLAAVTAAFGKAVLAADGTLDRRAMRERVFADADARRRLEGILHPLVRERLQGQASAARTVYVVVAIPLLAEVGARTAYPWIDRILVVDVPEDVQVQRVQQRDGASEALARQILASQATRAQRLAIADDVIVNAGPLDALDAHVQALDARQRCLAAAR